MTEVKLSSVEYEKLYSVYCAATELVNHKPAFAGTEVSEWVKEAATKRLKRQFKNLKIRYNDKSRKRKSIRELGVCCKFMAHLRCNGQLQM